MRHDCDICRGAGVIRLPIYRPASLRRLDEAAPMTMKMEESSRDYACPECAHEAPEEKVLILGAVTTVNERDVKQYRSQVEQPVRSQLAMLIAHKMIEDGVVEFSERPARMDVVELFARVGVVSKARVATIDKRATEKMGDFLNGVLEAAGDSIAIWGSDYTGNEGHIPKGMAIDFVSKAFSKALKDIQNGQ